MEAAIGHNKRKVGGVAVEQLKSTISRVERLEEEKAGLAADIRDVFAVKAIRTIIKMRKLDASEREEQETILEAYMNCLGMLPLFDDEDGEAA